MEQVFGKLRKLRQALVLLCDLLEGEPVRQVESHSLAAFRQVQAGFDALGDPLELAAGIEVSDRPRLQAEIAELERLRKMIVIRLAQEKETVELTLERVRETRRLVVQRVGEPRSGEHVNIAG